MRLTKMGHACIRLEKDGATLVIDPGAAAFSPPEALDGADAVLVTHEHVDHFAEDRLRAAAEASPGLEIWTNRTVADTLDGLGGRVRAVGPGDTFSAAGFDIEVHGEWHAVIHPDVPRVRNVGFVVDGLVFHPGDALTVPGRPVAALLLPVFAPWSKVSEVIDYVREVRPQQAFPVHDSVLSDVGLALYDRLVGQGGSGTAYGRLDLRKAIDVA
jgi:L-ascorbate metabolism protein UlaG (beta-lactamase superfamily)